MVQQMESRIPRKYGYIKALYDFLWAVILYPLRRRNTKSYVDRRDWTEISQKYSIVSHDSENTILIILYQFSWVCQGYTKICEGLNRIQVTSEPKKLLVYFVIQSILND